MPLNSKSDFLRPSLFPQPGKGNGPQCIEGNDGNAQLNHLRKGFQPGNARKDRLVEPQKHCKQNRRKEQGDRRRAVNAILVFGPECEAEIGRFETVGKQYIENGE